MTELAGDLPGRPHASERSASRERGSGQPPPGPVIAATRQSLQWFRNPVDFMERNRARYGPVFSVRLGPLKRAAFVSDPDGIRKILRAPAGATRSGDANGIFKPVVGRSSLLVLDGAEHVAHRKAMKPCFADDEVRRYRGAIAELADAECDRIGAGGEVRMEPHLERIALATIIRLTLGLDPGSPGYERIVSRFRPAMALCDSPFTLLPQFRHNLFGLSPYARLMRMLAHLDEAFYAEIAARRADPSVTERDDMVSRMIALGEPEEGGFDDRALRDELMTMLMAGHETTTSALAWTLERLARNPGVHARLVNAIDAGKDTYLDAVVRESLRQRPVVPVLVRKLVEPMEVSGYRFEAGWVLMPCIYLAHHEPMLYRDPARFRPERFLGAQDGSSLWIPFGGGGRRCIGAHLGTLELREVLRTILSRFELAPLDSDEPARRQRFTLTPARGARLTLQPR